MESRHTQQTETRIGPALYVEDDATRGLPAHEGPLSAFRRLTGRPFSSDQAEAKEVSPDGTLYVFRDVVLWLSAPGESAIYERKVGQ